MNTIKYIVLLIILSGFITVYGSNNKQKIRDNFMNHVHTICANPDIIEIDKSPDGYIEIEFICDGKRYEMGVKNNKLLFCEYRTSRDEIPYEKIEEKLKKDYSGWVFDEISRVIMPDTTFLKVELVNNGIEHNLYFTNDGKWYKIKPLNSDENFDIAHIRETMVYNRSAYQFLQPDSVYDLPDILKEVSGIALSENGNIYAVQDELGAIFEFHPASGKLVQLYRFTDVGDFEGLASDNNTLYILRSDGKLFIYDTTQQKLIDETMLHTGSLNLEGICLDKNYIYTVSKEPTVGEDTGKRLVYKFPRSNPKTTSVFLEIEIEALSRFAEAHYPQLHTTPFQFNPSAIEIHPFTGDIYILSANDRWLAIYKNNELDNLIPLSASLYHKPEGLAFLQNGDLLISSEGEKKGFTKGSISLLKQQVQ